MLRFDCHARTFEYPLDGVYAFALASLVMVRHDRTATAMRDLSALL